MGMARRWSKSEGGGGREGGGRRGRMLKEGGETGQQPDLIQVVNL